jgi:hypothetical protein
MPMNPRLLRPLASGVHPEAAAWRTAVVANGGSVSASTMKAVSKFCADIDAANIRSKFIRVGIFAGNDLLAALVPLYRGTSRTGTQEGNTTDTNSGGVFVAGDYSESLGLLGSSGAPRKFLATGVANSVIGATGHFAYYSSGDMTSTGTRRAMEIDGGSPLVVVDKRNNSRNFFQYGAGASFSASVARAGSGLRFGQRLSSTSLQLFFGATAEVDETGSATSAVTVTNTSSQIRVFSNGENFPYRMSAYSLGLTMTSGEIASYNTAMVALQTALGRA